MATGVPQVTAANKAAKRKTNPRAYRGVLPAYVPLALIV
jgi:hypothetical protein